MDNVNYNFEIVEILYKAKSQNGNDLLFNKPITILLVAMIECMLEDFMVRIKTHSSEVIPNLVQSVVAAIRGKQLDKFGHVIVQVEKHNLLRVASGDTIYAELEFLRKVRNRMHIQEMDGGLDKDEYQIFTDLTRKKAERAFERTCEVLCNIHPRWGSAPLPMADFPRPWI